MEENQVLCEELQLVGREEGIPVKRAKCANHPKMKEHCVFMSLQATWSIPMLGAWQGVTSTGMGRQVWAGSEAPCGQGSPMHTLSCQEKAIFSEKVLKGQFFVLLSTPFWGLLSFTKEGTRKGRQVTVPLLSPSFHFQLEFKYVTILTQIL